MGDYVNSVADAVKPVASMARALADYARNGRWGTCSGCPLDGNGAQVPELCQFTNRYDHLLPIDALAFQIRWREDATRADRRAEAELAVVAAGQPG